MSTQFSTFVPLQALKLKSKAIVRLFREMKEYETTRESVWYIKNSGYFSQRLTYGEDLRCAVQSRRTWRNPFCFPTYHQTTRGAAGNEEFDRTLNNSPN